MRQSGMHMQKIGFFMPSILETMDFEQRATEIFAAEREGDVHSHFVAVKKFYDLIVGVPYDAHILEKYISMTPIETPVWEAIRALNLPFYPQYPIGKYFADFADPIAMQTIECDGKGFHDYAKDYHRDIAFEEMGWTVLRMTGSQCNLDINKTLSPYNVIRERFGR